MSTPNPGAQNPYAPPAAPVKDVADTTGSGELADRATRLGAFIIDGVILAIVYAPAAFGAFGRMMQLGVAGGAAGGTAPSRLDMYEAFYLNNPNMPYTAVLFLIWAVITIVLVARNGQSIGKRLLGIRVVRTDGKKASFWRIFLLRNVVNSIPSLIPFVSFAYFLIDSLAILGESRRCIHDYIAGTIVVKA
jgi:uncharacterized RDD family membrane protein YckC